MARVETVTLEEARAVTATARAEASRIGQPMVVAVVDAGGHLLVAERMDGAWLGSVDVAINKAFTARAFDMETSQLGQFVQPGAPAFGLQHSNGGRIMAFEGGFPLQRDGVVVGAFGVSGGYGGQDEQVGQAALRAFAELATSTAPATTMAGRDGA